MRETTSEPGPERKQRVPDDFDKVARRYDLLARSTPGYAKHLAWSARRMALPPAGARARYLLRPTGWVDAGAGARDADAELVAIDASREMSAAVPAQAGARPGALPGRRRDASGGGRRRRRLRRRAHGLRRSANVPDPGPVPGPCARCSGRARGRFHEYSVADSRAARAGWNASRPASSSRWARPPPAPGAVRYLRRRVLAFDGVRAFEARCAGRLRRRQHQAWTAGSAASCTSFLWPGAGVSAPRRGARGGGRRHRRGVAAATVLAERAVRVTRSRRNHFWAGGPARGPTSWRRERFAMERGFHGFFRQYYNLRRLLRRVDPQLANLAPAGDYPILGPDGQVESFAGLPRRAPWNLAALALRTPTIRARDLLGIRARPALAMLSFDPEQTYARWDWTSRANTRSRAAPQQRGRMFRCLRPILLQRRGEMSAAERLMMFHWYVVPARGDLRHARRPWRRRWRAAGDYLTGAASMCALRRADSVSRSGAGWRVELDAGAVEADALVLAMTVPALQRLVAASPDLLRDAQWSGRVRALPLTRPFAVWRLWLDRPAEPGRAPFAGTTGFGRLDNISVYDSFQDESGAWARARGGSVIELHAYAVDADADLDGLRAELLAGLHALYPETRAATILDQRFLWKRDCSGFPPGTHAQRIGVATPYPGAAVAGDFTPAVCDALMSAPPPIRMMAASLLPVRSRARAETRRCRCAGCSSGCRPLGGRA